MPLYAHHSPPLDLGKGEPYSAIEIIEAGLTHPLVSNYVEDADQTTRPDILAHHIVAGATGFRLDHTDDGYHIHREYTAWRDAVVATAQFLIDLPRPVFLRVVNEIRAGKDHRAFTIMQTYNNMMHSLVEGELAEVA